ncbi:SulP family inorganic anion transporter [Gordonia sp. ABSL1-1]|uniref:SulP family inorganic anion transporter n=1 Tax=Gordonia sp. ABSL1-1 TaxID=3053923 RepID=UPI002573E9E2|nr:SulP family inorganic anion transporter [Gordonia sp. ABSL1-1]MDL9935416.1 SulP family inorganic anion transporter [Gordonia sp. ABSL1-1]
MVAGATLAAIAIPECMGYSSIAHVPLEAGLYTIILPAIVFALVGASKLMVVGADSATAALLASGIAGLGIAGLAPDSREWLMWASLIALVTAGILFGAWLLRLGFLGDFLSTAVLVGFLTGTGITVLTGQVPGMLGVEGTEGRLTERWWYLAKELPQVDPVAIAISVTTIAVLVAAKRFTPRFPVAIMVVAVSIVIVKVADWDIPVVGAIDGGLPPIGLPDGMSWSDIPKAATVAVGAAIVILAQSAATARGFAQRHGETADVNRDILGLAGANAIAGFSGSFVVNGSPTKTQILDEQRARTQVANLTMAGVTLVVVVFLGDALADLPHAVLSAIVAVVAVDLIDLHALRRIWRMRRVEFGIAIFTAIVVMALGVQDGIVTAMAISLLELVRRQYRPERFVIVVDEAGTRTYRKAEPGRQSLPGLIVFRYDADLFYANASRFADDVMELIRNAPDPVRWLVLDCTAIGDVDYSASAVMADLIAYVHSHGAHFVLAGIDPELQKTLVTEGLLADLDPDHVYRGVGSAVRAYREAYPGAP